MSEGSDVRPCHRGHRHRRDHRARRGHDRDRYGRPRRGIHALQVEINRGLYMDEQRITRASGYYALKDALEQVMAEIIHAARLLPRA